MYNGHENDPETAVETVMDRKSVRIFMEWDHVLQEMKMQYLRVQN